MKFNDLSIQEKAAVIKLGVGSGLRSLLQIEDLYNSISEGGDNALSVLGNNGSSSRDDGNKRNLRRMTIRDWLRGRKGNVNNTLNGLIYVDNGGKPYIDGSVASMDRLPWVPSVNPDTGQVNPRPDTYYYDNEGLLHMHPGNHVESARRMSQELIADFFWQMENPNNVGLNQDNGMYYKYRDPNGKDWDVGPGLVIGKAIEDKPYYTKEELDRAAYRYHMDAMDKLAPLYDEKYGSGAFSNIDDRSKLVASDVMYRVGLNGVNPEKWPNMFDAINSGNTAMMLQLSRSKFKDGNDILNYDNARVKRLGEYLYPGEFEYIFRNSLDPNIRVRKVELKKKGGYLSSTGPEYPPAIQKANRSKADFVKRLKDPNRAYILDWDNPDNIVTHKLSWVDDGVVYPLVLNVNGRLVDFSRPPYNIWAGYDNAVRNGDTIHMAPEEAEWFTTHYKDYYPLFNKYAYGGPKSKRNVLLSDVILNIPSLNEYLAKRAAEEQEQYYLEGSRNRKESEYLYKKLSDETKQKLSHVIKQGNKELLNTVKQFSDNAGITIATAFDYLENGKYLVSWNGKHQSWYDQYNTIKTQINNAKYELNEDKEFLLNCIATATSNNPNPNHFVTGNQTFRANPGKYGWKEVAKEEIRPGGLIQMAEYGYPDHAVILDFKDEDNMYVNYSPGQYPEYKKHIRNWVDPDNEYFYNFVGNSADSTRWTNEYNLLYGTLYLKGGLIHIKPFSYLPIPEVRY